MPQSEERHVVPLGMDCNGKNLPGQTFPPLEHYEIMDAKGEGRMCEPRKRLIGKPRQNLCERGIVLRISKVGARMEQLSRELQAIEMLLFHGGIKTVSLSSVAISREDMKLPPAGRPKNNRILEMDQPKQYRRSISTNFCSQQAQRSQQESEQAERARQQAILLLRNLCEKGDLDAVKQVVAAGAAVDASDNDGRQPIHYASYRGHLEVVQWLVLQGAAVDASDNHGSQPLHVACTTGHLEVAQWLVSQGAAVDAKDPGGRQPLHRACLLGHLKLAQWLVSQGAAVDAKDPDGRQPIHSASCNGKLEIVEWLVSQGAAVDASNSGRQPLAMAQEQGHSQVAAFLEGELSKLRVQQLQQAERARQQAEQELLAMWENEGQSKKKKKKKKSKKKKPSQSSNQNVVDNGAGGEGELIGRSEVERSDTTLHPTAEGEDAFDKSRDAANELLAQTIQDVSNQHPSKHGMAHLDAALAQATSADAEFIAQAKQQRKAIKNKLKKLKNKQNKVARAIEALEGAMAARTGVEQLADAIFCAELLVSSTPNDPLLDALALAKAMLRDAEAATETRSIAEKAIVDGKARARAEAKSAVEPVSVPPNCAL